MNEANDGWRRRRRRKTRAHISFAAVEEVSNFNFTVHIVGAMHAFAVKAVATAAAVMAWNEIAIHAGLSGLQRISAAAMAMYAYIWTWYILFAYYT